MIVREEWFKTQALRPNIELSEDEFVIMPNHIHGIIWIVEQFDNHEYNNHFSDIKENRYGTGDLQLSCTGTARRARTTGQFGHPVKGSLPTIVGAFKSAATKRINIQRGTPCKPLWLRNYYEHIIETEKEYINIANYIHNNPENWGLKDEYFSV
ncbi:MAG: transposase [Chloroflexi bacterium HGW-Chloroflexi-4]|nr:MAG: transposase [Chloroflexi bacterium HGW-Chloroflexi-4]